MYGRRIRRNCGYGRLGAFGQDSVAANQALEGAGSGSAGSGSAAGTGGSGGGFWKQLGDWLWSLGQKEGEKLLDKGVDKLTTPGAGGTASAPAGSATQSGPLVLRSAAGNVSTVDLMNYRPVGTRSADSPTLPGQSQAGSASLLPWWGWVAVAGGVIYVATRRR